MRPMTTEEQCKELDRVEADLVRMQSILWRLRQSIQGNRKIGYQYDDKRPADTSGQGVTDDPEHPDVGGTEVCP